ncbi:MAG: RHS repeat protein [Pyrinomonadaceae bacterium]|nr:RHS repeat protein [Pyrinomonadaceae bacterium]
MGRLHKQSNPTEVSSAWNPTGDDAAGWVYRSQLYDWKSRATVSTNTDSTQAANSYGGCGCAGGEVVTISDAVGRQKKVYSDVLGRPWKTEILNFDNTVYASSVNSYNARDQVTSTKEYQGEATSDGSCPTGTCQETTVSHDGYGRVAFQHAPEQVSGGNTAYTYKADDSLWTVSDARGARVSYSYNGRKLLTGINHSAAAPIFVPAAVSFDYDPAGNRRSMVDGMGYVVYQYDQLSRLLSESRSLNALPNAPVPNNAYTISYEYNLVGKVKGITDPFGYQVSYTHDTAGRLDSISRPGPQGFPDTMSDIHYRAFGKLKESTFRWNANSSTIAYTHDARMEVNRLQITSSVAGIQGAQYQRSNDGRVSYAQDLSDPEFDRGYSFDQMGRVTQGLTGAEARNTLPANGPYKQTYGYDAFSNLTSRTGRHWTKNVPTQTGSYVNNRNTQWQYDLDGRTTQAGTQQFRYDAAGRPVNPTGTLLDTYDGDGLAVKKYSPSASYELPSSVLGGQVVTQIGPQGNKEITYVYANGKRVGREGFWEIKSAINSGDYNIAYGSVVARTNEFSPIGDNVGVDNPYLDGGSWDRSLLYPAYGDPSTFTCAWNGLEVNCSSLNKFYLSKNREWILTLTIRGRVGGAVNQTKAELVPGGDQLGKVVYGSAGPGGEPSSVEIIAEPDSFELRSMGTMMNWIEMKPLEYGFVIPQRTQWRAVDPAEIRKALARMLDKDGCGKFVEELINRLAGDTGNPFVSDYALDLFDTVAGQGNFVRGGLADKNRVSSTVSGQMVYGKGKKPGNAAVHLGSYFNGPVQASSVNFIDAFDTLHELIHHAGLNDYYYDEQIAQTLFGMTGTPGLPDKKDYKNNRDFIGANSAYFSKVLSTKCPVLSR